MVNNFFLLGKFKNDQTQIIKYIKKSLEEGIKYHYYITDENDRPTLEKLRHHSEFEMIFIIFERRESEYHALELFLGHGEISRDNKLDYKILFSTDSKIVIDNFINSSGLDLKNDFMVNSYLSIETSRELFKQIEFALKGSYVVESVSYNEQVYGPIPLETNLCTLSQKNEHCKRAIAINSADGFRGEFQRDRERVVHAKASRRLVDKAQIFTSTKGDHFRTRMTHTLEVSQIARGLALRLNVNHDLTEAIALAHDIGHTPFGHQGERTLNSILRNEIKIIPCADEIDFGGFKHNYQGLRVLSYIEEKYFSHEGIDLSYQVLEGVLKHTGGKVKDCENCDLETCTRKCFDINEFLVHGESDYLFLEYKFPTTIEGQIVAIADEIAQRGHDLDDAFAAKHLSFDELLSYSEIRKMKPIKDILNNIQEDMEKIKNENKIFIDENDMLKSRLVPEILSYFIQDIVNQSQINIAEFNMENELYRKYHRVKEKLVEFSKEGKFILEYLERIITKKVINSFEVSRFDDKAKFIITSLFKSYYNNPKLLPDTTLARIYRDIRKISNNVIDFRNGDPKLIADEFSMICYSEPRDEGGKIDLNNEYICKREILVRNIADHISGMTDNYAMNEYNTIYGI
ncbi:deoxyguanosinetriphosphate triphosphohydrolase family protein [Clostridium sp. WILCCON 0185]|uniref:Deoxyguanosinetriphosphate triphosphohydrolase family protein n=1 Tax=Candidatus Clostridium stratigraminis TaxID=3381661 RepID=A0ABW8T464_9CLOT